MRDLWDSLMDALFGAATHRERQRAAMYARQTLATWERHRDGDPPEAADYMVEAARCVIDWYGDAAPQHTRIAQLVMEEVGRE